MAPAQNPPSPISPPLPRDAPWLPNSGGGRRRGARGAGSGAEGAAAPAGRDHTKLAEQRMCVEAFRDCSEAANISLQHLTLVCRSAPRGEREGGRTRRVRSVRKEGRDVSSQYGREGGRARRAGPPY